MRPCSGAWFFEHSDIDKLLESLQIVVDEIPFWCGKLRYVKYKFGGSVYERYTHMEVAYNFESDPGCEVQVAELGKSLDELVDATKTEYPEVWSPMDVSELIPMPSKPDEDQAIPILKVKISTLKCGTVCIGCFVPHALSDAVALQKFVHRWSCVYNGRQSESLVYDPREADSYALSLDIKDPAIIDQCNEIVSRDMYDFWACTEEDMPAEWLKEFNGPDELIEIEPLGKPPSMSKEPVICYKVYFSNIEIANMRKHIQDQGVQATRMIALSAHIWTCLNKVRGITDKSHATLNIGTRSRLSSTKLYGNYG